MAPSAGGLVDPFLPVGAVLFAGDEVLVIGFDDAAPSAVGLPDPFPPAGAVLFSAGRRIGSGLRRGSRGNRIGRRTCRSAFGSHRAIR